MSSLIYRLILSCLELSTANTQYYEKLQSNEKDSKALFAAGWKVEELKNLVESCQTLIATVSSVKDVIANQDIDFVERNVARTLSKLRESLRTFIRDLSRHQRHVATHIFVFMISCERRDIKPYAIPIQCLPYNSISQVQLRQLVCNVIKEMSSRGMKVAGEYTNFHSDLNRYSFL